MLMYVCYNGDCYAKSMIARTVIVWLVAMDCRQVTTTHLPFCIECC
jgi:hypothetical protein